MSLPRAGGAATHVRPQQQLDPVEAAHHARNVQRRGAGRQSVKALVLALRARDEVGVQVDEDHDGLPGHEGRYMVHTYRRGSTWVVMEGGAGRDWHWQAATPA